MNSTHWFENHVNTCVLCRGFVFRVERDHIMAPDAGGKGGRGRGRRGYRRPSTVSSSCTSVYVLVEAAMLLARTQMAPQEVFVGAEVDGGPTARAHRSQHTHPCTSTPTCGVGEKQGSGTDPHH